MADEIKYRKVTELSVSDTLNDEDNILIERNGSFMRVSSDAFSDIETDAGLTKEGAAADAKAVGDKFKTLQLELSADPKVLNWSDLSAYSSEDRAILLEAGKPVFIDSVQAVFDGLNDSSATLTIEGVAYTVRGLGEIKDSLMYKEGKLQICHKIIADGSSLNTSSEFEDVICKDLTAVIKQVILPCSPTELLGKKLARISYADCGAYLDGIHDDYEAMYRAHYIGNMTNCTVEQHGGQIYKANSGWLIIEDHNVDLSGSVLIIDEYNRYGYYWLSAYSIWDMSDDQTTAFREQMKEYSTYWPAAEINFRTNGLFLITYPGAATRYNSGEVTVEDRVEVVRHGADGKVYNSVIDDAPDNAEVRFSVYPETQLTFIGCTLKIDIYFSTVAMYFMRCCRSNCVIRDFVIDPSRRTTNNTGYRGHVFDIQECADVTLENIKGINIAGKPNEEYPRGTAGYILHAYCALNLMVRDCYMLGYWGCTGLNGVKDVTFDNCDLNRVDTHDYFRNLTINNCRLYGQVIQVGYGKGAVNISNCSVMTDWVNYVLNLRCDYGRYFEGEINISNINVVFTGSGSYDIVGGTSMFSQTSAEKTGMYIKRYPTVKVTNATIRVLNDSSAGYVFNLPTDIESLIRVDDKRKVVDCLNLTVYNDAGDLLTMPLCSLDGVVAQDQVAMMKKMQEIFGIDAGAIQQVEKVVRPDKHVPKDLFSITKKQVFVHHSRYAYALYTVDPTQTYYVTGSAHTNSGEYPVGGFYDADGALISMFGTSADEVYTKQPIQPPENAVTMAVNKTIQTQAIEVTIKVTLTGSELIDGIVAQAEDTSNRVKDFLDQYEKDNTPSIGPAITPDSTVEGQLYDVVLLTAYGDQDNYGHSFYTVTGGNKYFVTCVSASNPYNFPGGAFYDADGNLLCSIGEEMLTRYTDHLVTAPSAAAKLVLNKNGGLASVVCKVGVESVKKSAASKPYDLGMADTVVRLEKKNPFQFAPFDNGYISFVFDDLTNDIDGIAATFEEFGVPICIAAIPEKLDNVASGLSETRGSYTPNMFMREVMQKAVVLGGEVMAHNVDVITMENQYNYEFMYSHVINCKNSLEAAGFAPRGFIRAGGEGAVNNSAEIERWLIGNFEYSNQGVLPQYAQERVTINQSIDAIKAIIDSCKANKTWVRFMCHGYAYGGGTTFANENDLREILTYAQGADVSIVTYAHMFDNFGSTRFDELLENSLASPANIDYLYYSRRTLAFNGANTNIRLRLPYEETAVIYHVKYRLISGTDVTMTITDWNLTYEASGDEDVYIRLPAGVMSNSKEMIFAVYPGTSNSGVYEVIVERTADTDAYTGTIQLDFAS